MPGVSAAPVPSARLNAAAGPPTAANPSAGADAAPNDAQFAAILGQQMNPDQAARIMLQQKVAKALGGTEAAPATPAVDNMTALAAVLAGLGATRPTASGPAQAGEGERKAKGAGEGSEADTAIVLALPLTAQQMAPGLPASAQRSAENFDGRPEEPVAALLQTTTTASSAAISAGLPVDISAGKLTAETSVDARSEPANLVASAVDAAAAALSHASGISHMNPAKPSPVTTAEIAAPFGTPGWSHEVGEKLSWMVGRQETRAELVLNPPQLGRIEISLSLSGDQANASFVSANPAVRDALENAMSHLRETLQSAGISLGQAQVGAESFRQSAGQRENSDNSVRANGAEGVDGVGASSVRSGDAPPTQWGRRGNGLVDTFA